MVEKFNTIVLEFQRHTVDGRNPAPVDGQFRVLYILGGAGFLPSTVSPLDLKEPTTHGNCIIMFLRFFQRVCASSRSKERQPLLASSPLAKT